MTLAAVIDQDGFDALGTDMAREYKPLADKEGMFLLDVTKHELGFELSDVTGLRSALSKERDARKLSDKKFKPFSQLGEDFDLDAAIAAVKKLEELDGLDPEDKIKEARAAMEKQLQTKFFKMEERLTTKHGEEVKGHTDRGEKLEAQLRKALIDSSAVSAITKHRGVPELLLHPVRDRVRLIEQEDSGEFVVRIVDNDGHERLSPRSGAGAHDFMTIEELVGEFTTDERFARAFDGSGTGGSGATGSDGSTGTSTHRISPADALDSMKYRAAKARADKAGVVLQITG